MLVNIDEYIRKQLLNTKYGNLKNLEEKSISTIYNFIHRYKITSDAILTDIISGKVNLKEQSGGTLFNIKLKDNRTYHYEVKNLTSKRSTKHNLCFVNIRDIEHNCLCFTYHSKSTGIKIAELNDLNATEDCVVCEDPRHKFKIGDILMQIFLELIKTNEEFAHIDTIQLQDNSTKKCYGYGIPLKYLRTITDGIPYYAKYGFRPTYPTDITIFRFNREHHKINIVLENNVLIDIFDNTKNYKNQNVYKTYKKYLRKSLLEQDKINPSTLLKKIMDISDEKLNLSKQEKNGFCELINMSIKAIYLACNYKDYNNDLWSLNIKRT